MRSRSGWARGAIAGACLALTVAAMVAASSLSYADDDSLSNECELGIALAFSGEMARAESVFISLLSHSPRDARAYANLGNLHLLHGETEVALSFYAQARASDSTDAGIVLNQATALLLLGDVEAAEARASLGVKMAGGALAAAALLGLRYDGTDAEMAKGAEKAYLNKDEILALLRAASGHVPSDSTKIAAPTDTSAAARAARAKKRAPVWRSAGPRAGDSEASATLVYWKR